MELVTSTQREAALGKVAEAAAWMRFTSAICESNPKRDAASEPIAKTTQANCRRQGCALKRFFLTLFECP
jgi:hypothetical protein